MKVPAIVMAGDLGAAKPIFGQSKIYLEIEGVPMVARVVATLQRVPEVSEIWVIGDRQRLEKALSSPDFEQDLEMPMRILEQHSNLYENAWTAFKHSLPGADGREPAGPDLDFQVLYISGDLPLATPEEISTFIREGQALDCDYALGLARDSSLGRYSAESSGGRGLDIAYFNLRDGRLKQNNLHLAKPGRILNRRYIQDLYRHRHMRKFGNMAGLIGKLLFREGGIAIFFFYVLMHLAGVADRNGWKRAARWIRHGVTVKVNEWGVSKLMDCRFRFVISDYGGCAIDVDTEEDYNIIRENFRGWVGAEMAAPEIDPRPSQPSPRSAGDTEPDAGSDPPRKLQA